MKVVAVNGSARKNGNTACLIGAVFDSFKRKESKRKALLWRGR